MTTRHDSDLLDRLSTLGDHLDIERASIESTSDLHHDAPRHDSRRFVVAAASVVIIAGGLVALTQLDRDQPSQPASSPAASASVPATQPLVEPPSEGVPSIPTASLPATGNDLSGQQMPVPGITSSTDSESTAESEAFAAFVNRVLVSNTSGLELREDATRTTRDGDQVMWVYFLDGDRRLFIVQGPPDLLDDSVLVAGADGYEWPAVAGASTIAVSDAFSTVIVRSESIDPSGSTRSPDDLRLIAQLVKDGSP